MKLLRFGPNGQEKPGLLDADGKIRDLTGVVADIDGGTITPESLERLRAIDPASLPLVEGEPRLGACVARPGKFICIGLNYADHAAETGAAIPDEPILFMKATSALSGPNDPIVKPRDSTKLDWEVELAFVVGTECRYVDEAQAEAAIAGYFVCNDVSERAFQLERGGTWDKGKGCDSFGPIGPWLVTADEVGDTSDLHMWLEVNGKRYQDGSTSTMIFRPGFILSYLSRFMSLQPGDIVTTGTPPGVGLGQNPNVWLHKGDRIALGIAGLGEQHQVVIEA
ncbi:5-carboxymethyl-2-hydroxymuconate isomerase [Sphingomonas kyeonggiensis]|uniref:5-carboxymethyl-2-hydroxymuconate isomerase n=1 Tax=Sphingomonas kyeonggiensis TaxID=1268553 RepID=A0A7W7K3H6_9SPHN|nr:fumarylacetoacetate hydrolase family protein [Sphingomonas kyeonggiensis]MBB4840339.1 5-carboxymethyl-2-hydroxymuconate isomerase [Sphingomonas kyeonggiensis]